MDAPNAKARRWRDQLAPDHSSKQKNFTKMNLNDERKSDVGLKHLAQISYNS